MYMSLSKLGELVMDREPWQVAVHGITKSLTERLNWTDFLGGNFPFKIFSTFYLDFFTLLQYKF